MLSLFLWSALLFSQASPAGDSVFAVSITTEGMPAAVGTPRLVIDGTPSSILPALVEVKIPAGETRKIEVWGAEFQHYSFSLLRSGEGVQLTNYSDTCQKERATPSLSASSHSLKIVMAFHIGLVNCSSSASTALPNARIKIRFQSDPSDAILFFDNTSAFTSSALPAVLSLGYLSGMRLVPFTVYYKKAGYFDCARQFKLVLTNGSYQLEIDSKQIVVAPGDIPDSAAPVVACTLKKAP
jgi:hypothetical protein